MYTWRHLLNSPLSYVTACSAQAEQEAAKPQAPPIDPDNPYGHLGSKKAVKAALKALDIMIAQVCKTFISSPAHLLACPRKFISCSFYVSPLPPGIGLVHAGPAQHMLPCVQHLAGRR